MTTRNRLRLGSHEDVMDPAALATAARDAFHRIVEEQCLSGLKAGGGEKGCTKTM